MIGRSHLCVWLSCTVLPWMAVSPAQAQQSPDGPHRPPASDQVEGPELFVDEFGVVIGKPFDAGFVFFDGKYLEAPYAVTRKGLAIFIDEVMIEPPHFTWPPRKVDPDYGAVDPPLPASLDKDTSKYDPLFADYLGRKIAFIIKHNDPESAPAKLLQMLRGLPNTKVAEFLDPANPLMGIRVARFDGDVDNVDIRHVIYGGRKGFPHDKDSLLQYSEEVRQNYEARLKEGSCYFFFSKSGRIAMGASQVPKLLPELVRILRSTMREEEKFDAMQRAGLSNVTTTAHAKLVSGFKASEQLESRLEAVIKRMEEEKDGGSGRRGGQH